MGFTTANQREQEPGKLLQADCVYALRERMLNIGVRPTVDNGGDRSVEVHILRFGGDIYGEHMRVDFVQRIRNEQKFAGTDELVAQLRRDAAEVERLLLSPSGDDIH